MENDLMKKLRTVTEANDLFTRDQLVKLFNNHKFIVYDGVKYPIEYSKTHNMFYTPSVSSNGMSRKLRFWEVRGKDGVYEVEVEILGKDSEDEAKVELTSKDPNIGILANSNYFEKVPSILAKFGITDWHMTDPDKFSYKYKGKKHSVYFFSSRLSTGLSGTLTLID